MTGQAPATNHIAIVGNTGGTNVGESLRRAALSQGRKVTYFDAGEATRGSRLLRALAWRLADGRPLRLRRFNAHLLDVCEKAPPQVLIATGAAPLTGATLDALRSRGVVCINFSTDDPWNRAMRAGRLLRALPHYDLVFTPRRANLEDFRRIGCRDVRYLPFGYDADLFSSPERSAQTPCHDVLFVGGADRDRVEFIADFMRTGPSVALVGAYWDRYAETRAHVLGHKPPDVLRSLTANAKVNLCLVRRANRDGHVMRSFEIGATGGCMLVEDTPEHREILGPDGECVVYFSTPREAGLLARDLIADPAVRARLSAAVRERMLGGRYAYADRLMAMLEAAEDRLAMSAAERPEAITP